MPFPIAKAGIFAISSMPDPLRYSVGAAAMREAGIKPVEGPAFLPFRRMAGTDKERADAFNALAADDSLDALFAARGGHGALRILDLVDFAGLRRSRAWIIGYSDVCALLLSACHHGVRRLIHGPMVCSGWDLAFSEPEAFDRECAALEKLLLPRRTTELLPAWHGARPLRCGRAAGRLVPANLTILQSLIGTGHLPDLHGAILVLEDVHAPAHAIDRMLGQLRLAGILGGIAAIVFGKFADADDGDEIPEILHEYADGAGVPAAWDLHFGHIHPSVPLPVGAEDVVVEISGNGVRMLW